MTEHDAYGRFMELIGFARRTAATVQTSLKERDDNFIAEVDALGGIQELLHRAEIISEQHDFYNRLAAK